jgi:hypothetical protein
VGWDVEGSTDRNAADAGANGSNFLKERKWQCEGQWKQ